jgi:ubiquinone/menaquinone biosynthesis C-methylase UbiE
MNIDDPELDPRFALLYDAQHVWDECDNFFLELINVHPGSRVVDVGCGTGALTTAIALAGHTVVGVDPNPAFLNIASHKSGGDQVAWIRGTSSDLPDSSFDIAIMTGNVPQVFITDEEWMAVLGDLKRALVPGGLLAFHTRDPAARAWEAWAENEPTRIPLPDGTVVDDYTTMTFSDDVARFETVHIFSDGKQPLDPTKSKLTPGTTWSSVSYAYRFRSADLVRRSLGDVGFRVEKLLGGFHQEELGAGVGAIVVIAQA